MSVAQGQDDRQAQSSLNMFRIGIQGTLVELEGLPEISLLHHETSI
ncbi:MAG: hypothetical protein U5L00_12780 [Desulfovermiculus sp.]|nr:hypothetical protein [Desulfovermiculus sp.]